MPPSTYAVCHAHYPVLFDLLTGGMDVEVFYTDPAHITLAYNS